MSITIVQEPSDPGWPADRCCFCRAPSRTWEPVKDVAVCESCAQAHEPEQVPSKADWFRKERQIERAAAAKIGLSALTGC